ncbi:MAG: threonine/serine exporter family protein, partial [Myxococcota bacterium]
MPLSTTDRSSWLRFATSYATALHRAGAPAPTIESEVTRVLGARGVDATLMASPTALWIDVDGSRVVRVGPAQTDLGRQVALAEVGERVAHGLAPDPAADEVERVEATPTAWSDRALDLAFLAASAGAAVLVGGSGTDVVAAGAIGWVASRARRAAAARPGW